MKSPMFVALLAGTAVAFAGSALAISPPSAARTSPPAAARAVEAPAPGEPETPAADPAVVAEEAPDEAAAALARRLAAVEASLHYQTGDVEIGNRLAVLHLPATFRYLDAEGAGRVLSEWGNPPRTTLGMLVPAEISPMDADGWGVIITYVDDGHVDDSDAASLNYTELLQSMQTRTREANPERERQGFAPVRLVGWAEPPHYDRSTHVLYWAKDAVFGNATEHTLNYSARFLGRVGVLEMNAVATTTVLPHIRTQMASLMPFVEFRAGNRYSDFRPDVDHTAAYGIGALIAGGAIAKSGVLKGLLVALFAAKKAVFAGLLALGAGVRRLLSRKSNSSDPTNGP